ncbi:MAG: hypothetical protein ACLT8E_03590 [Akkermansia sp.]
MMRTFTWPIALPGGAFLTVAFAVLNTVVPLWMEQSDAATREAGLVGLFFLGNLAGTLMAGGVIRKAGFKGGYQYACMLWRRPRRRRCVSRRAGLSGPPVADA